MATKNIILKNKSGDELYPKIASKSITYNHLQEGFRTVIVPSDGLVDSCYAEEMQATHDFNNVSAVNLDSVDLYTNRYNFYSMLNNDTTFSLNEMDSEQETKAGYALYNNMFDSNVQTWRGAFCVSSPTVKVDFNVPIVWNSTVWMSATNNNALSSTFTQYSYEITKSPTGVYYGKMTTYALYSVFYIDAEDAEITSVSLPSSSCTYSDGKAYMIMRDTMGKTLTIKATGHGVDISPKVVLSDDIVTSAGFGKTTGMPLTATITPGTKYDNDISKTFGPFITMDVFEPDYTLKVSPSKTSITFKSSTGDFTINADGSVTLPTPTDTSRALTCTVTFSDGSTQAVTIKQEEKKS